MTTKKYRPVQKKLSVCDKASPPGPVYDDCAWVCVCVWRGVWYIVAVGVCTCGGEVVVARCVCARGLLRGCVCGSWGGGNVGVRRGRVDCVCRWLVVVGWLVGGA